MKNNIFLSCVLSRWEVAGCPNKVEQEKIPVFVFSPGPLPPFEKLMEQDTLSTSMSSSKFSLQKCE